MADLTMLDARFLPSAAYIGDTDIQRAESKRGEYREAKWTVEWSLSSYGRTSI